MYDAYGYLRTNAVPRGSLRDNYGRDKNYKPNIVHCSGEIRIILRSRRRGSHDRHTSVCIVNVPMPKLYLGGYDATRVSAP